MTIKSRLKKVKKNLNNISGMRPRKLEDYFCNNLKNTYVPKITGKRLEDYFT
jgi:hypothetical protein